jgi:hypothetical protein
MNLPRRFLPFSSIHRILTLVTALWLGGAMAQAQVAGRLFLLNPQTGAYLAGGIDIGGFFHAAPAGTRSTLKGTTSVVANNTALVAYNSSTGYSEFVVIDGYGNVKFNPQQFNTSATTIVGSASDFLFYYGNANQGGTGSFIATQEGGTYLKTLQTAGLSPWSNIVQTDDYLCFYNFQTGLFDQTTLSPVTQSLQQDSTAVVTLPPGYNVMAPVNDNLIMYNSGTGAYEVLGLYFTGTQKDFPDKRDSGTLKEYYGAILPTAGQVVFYGYGTGDALTATVGPNGLLQQEKDITLPLYTGAVTTGAYLAFYNAATGTLDVYSISASTGVLSLRSTQNIGPGYTAITATKS